MLSTTDVRLALCFALAAAAHTVRAQTEKPGRIAIGMIQGQQLPSATVEITTDGWVQLSLIATRVDGGVQPPSMRLIVEPRDVRKWAADVRAMLKTRSDPNNAPEQHLLGNGNYQLNATHKWRDTTSDDVYFAWRACGSGWGSSTPSRAELAKLVDLLDSAAVEAGGGLARPPTLKEPYYAMEVSCPAMGEPSHWLPFPANVSSRERVPTEIGVRFVVDTTGKIESGSMRFLPETPIVLRRAAEAAIGTWRFRPAEWDGAPVRQIVQTTLTFSSVVPATPGGTREISFKPEADGWVRLERRPGEFGRAADQEWFAPDSVDAWIARVGRLRVTLDSARKYQRAQIDSLRRRLEATFDSVIRVGARLDDSAQRRAFVADSTRRWRELDDQRRRVPATGNVGATLGSPRGRRYSIVEHATATGSKRTAGFYLCAGSGSDSDYPLTASQMNQLARAARAARANRSPPADPRATIHMAPGVACPAWLMWMPSQRAGFTRVWRYPTGLYPESMAKTNERAELLVSVVIDTAGVAEPETAVVISESNANALEALPATLRALRFTPATRGGIAVSQRVIQAIRFEPPPLCRVPEASPSCPRRYRDEGL
jgi:hypothetical protein